MLRRLRGSPSAGLALVFGVGALLGGDWGAAIAAMIDSHRDSLSRPAELALAGALAVLGGVAGCWLARGRKP
jgi:hypothetical protein